MKLNYISPSKLPSRSANSIHVVWQCEALCHSGVEVTLYAKRAMPDGLQLESELRNVYGVAHPALRLDTVYSNSGCGDSLHIAHHAVRAIGRSGYNDAILSRNLYAAFSLAVLHKVPLLFETHQLETGFRKWMQRAIMLCPWVTTIVISAHLAKYLAEHHGAEPHRTLVLHDAAPAGISPVRITERRDKLCALVPEAQGSWKQVCGYFGHLYSGRGIEIVEAIAAARKDCLFLVYGGSETDIAARRASNRQVNLAFMGHVAHPVARDLMRMVDMLLMPYQESVSIGVSGHDTARWMSPMKMFEYLGAGVPIISSDLPVLQEVLLDGENCLLARPSDVDSWLAALDHIAGNPELAAHIGSNAHDQYERDHTWTRRAEKIIEAAYEL
jgi:glycosyltransferase involved in cell wall biosynthesis